MLFNSLPFLIFFPIVCLIYFLIPGRFRWLWLLAASYYYYMSWNPRYALLLLLSTGISWLSGLWIAKAGLNTDKIKGRRLQKWSIAFSFSCNLLILFFFKYSQFGIYTLNRLLRLLHLSVIQYSFDVLLPIGISFYLLQSLSYTMDVYRGRVTVERNFLKYALFVSFFPQLLSGPIERSQDLLPQIRQPHAFDYQRVKRGLWLMLWGYFQKLVIADRAALFVNKVFSDATNYDYGGVINITAIMLFSLQVYCDFAGYSNIAIGAAEVLGFHLTANFKRPFFSSSASDFWTRWHISLSRWFVSYLYIPMGGNRVGRLRYYFNLMVVFLSSGLWHGANWTYVVWGGLNGLFCVLEKICDPLYQKVIQFSKIDVHSFGHKCVQALYCFVLFNTSVVFFRASTVSQALAFFKGMRVFNPQVLFNDSLFSYGLDRVNFELLFLSILVLFVVSWNQRSGSLRDKINRQPLPFRWSVVICGILAVLLFGIYGPGFDASQFIYVQF